MDCKVLFDWVSSQCGAVWLGIKAEWCCLAGYQMAAIPCQTAPIQTPIPCQTAITDGRYPVKPNLPLWKRVIFGLTGYFTSPTSGWLGIYHQIGVVCLGIIAVWCCLTGYRFISIPSQTALNSPYTQSNRSIILWYPVKQQFAIQIPNQTAAAGWNSHTLSSSNKHWRTLSNHTYVT